MNNFTIAAAQSSSIKGDFKQNIEEHLKFIKIAADKSADLIVFPELSLTGYEPELAQELALCNDDVILNPLKYISSKLNITIISGCPIRSDSVKPYVGAFIIQPGNSISMYKKRYLHKGEDRYFIPSQDNVIHKYNGELIAIAICADINHPSHPSNAKKKDATIYAAGVFMTPTGIDEAAKNMSNYAARYNMLAVMANYATTSGGYTTAGRSAIWDNTGKLLAFADETGRALVIANKHKERWTGKIIKV